MRFNFGVSGLMNSATEVVLRAAYDANSTMYVTKVTFAINTHANAKFQSVGDETQTITVATCRDLTKAAGVPDVVTFDFGKTGIPITTGQDLVTVGEATGIAGWVYAEGYEVRG